MNLQIGSVQRRDELHARHMFFGEPVVVGNEQIDAGRCRARELDRIGRLDRAVGTYCRVEWRGDRVEGKNGCAILALSRWAAGPRPARGVRERTFR